MKTRKRKIALWLAAAALTLGISPAAQARSLKDYEIRDVKGYAFVAMLEDGEILLRSDGTGEDEVHFSRRMADGTERYALSVPHHISYRGTMGGVFLHGRYAIANAVDPTHDEIYFIDEEGQTSVIALPEGSDYFRIYENGVALLYRSEGVVRLIDDRGEERLTLCVPTQRELQYMEILEGGDRIYLVGPTMATAEENAMDAPYYVCGYDTEGNRLFETLIDESEAGFWLYGPKTVDAQGGLLLAGADKEDYAKEHVLRMDDGGKVTYHRVLSQEEGAIVSVSALYPLGEGVKLVGSVTANSRGLFCVMQLTMDDSGEIVSSDMRDFDLTDDYLYDVRMASDGAVYATKEEWEDIGIGLKAFYRVPFDDLPAAPEITLR